MKKQTVFGLAVVTLCLLALENGSLRHARGAENWRGYDTFSKETRAILDQSEKLLLISIDPNRLARETKINKAEKFHKYPVLGRTEITDAKRKSELLSALYGAAYEYQGRLYSCFDPRHGIIAVAGTNRVELVICFECHLVEEFVNSSESQCLIHDSPREIFNRTLTEARVPLAKK
jgi:regulator of extracellular matrix RemA (YlzA/DUF370 family)